MSVAVLLNNFLPKSKSGRHGSVSSSGLIRLRFLKIIIHRYNLAKTHIPQYTPVQDVKADHCYLFEYNKEFLSAICSCA